MMCSGKPSRRGAVQPLRRTEVWTPRDRGDVATAAELLAVAVARAEPRLRPTVNSGGTVLLTNQRHELEVQETSSVHTFHRRLVISSCQ